MINIITRSPSTQRGAGVIARVGKNGFYDHGFRVSGKAQEVVDWRISASNRRAVNFEPYLHTTPDGKTALNDREFITRSVFNLSATAQVAARDELSLMLGLSDGESDRGSRRAPPTATRGRWARAVPSPGLEAQLRR